MATETSGNQWPGPDDEARPADHENDLVEGPKVSPLGATRSRSWPLVRALPPLADNASAKWSARDRKHHAVRRLK